MEYIHCRVPSHTHGPNTQHVLVIYFMGTTAYVTGVNLSFSSILPIFPFFSFFLSSLYTQPPFLHPYALSPPRNNTQSLLSTAFPCWHIISSGDNCATTKRQSFGKEPHDSVTLTQVCAANALHKLCCVPGWGAQCQNDTWKIPTITAFIHCLLAWVSVH